MQEKRTWKKNIGKYQQQQQQNPKALVMAVLCAVYLHIHLLIYVFTYYSEQGSEHRAENFDATKHEMDVTEHVIRSTKRIAVPF